MIVTQRKQIPWWWVFLMCLPWVTNSFVESCSGSALTFTMKKFISDPALITFLGSINIAFNFMVAPLIAWKSDRIWTRFGRRKPFVIVGWIGLASSLVFTPIAPNIWVLALVIILYQFFQDIAFSGPMEPLFFEVVPLRQRGRASALRTAMANGVNLFYNYFLIKHFHEVHDLSIGLGPLGRADIVITGEQIIYWGAAAIILVMIFHIAFNVKEKEVHNPSIGDPFSFKRYFVGIFGEKQWLLIYLLIFAQISMNTGLAQLHPLLVTEQFGYTMDTLGNIATVTLLLKLLLVIPAAGFIADKFDRLRLFQCGLVLSTMHPLLYFCFVKLIAVDQIPSPQAIVAFDIFGSFVDVAGNIAMTPLLFDYVPRNRMGTVFAGMTFARGMVKLTVVNGVGLWVRGYSKIFMPEGQWDYMSGYLYVFVVGLFGIAASIYFARERAKGHIIEYGRLDIDQPERPPNDDAKSA